MSLCYIPIKSVLIKGSISQIFPPPFPKPPPRQLDGLYPPSSHLQLAFRHFSRQSQSLPPPRKLSSYEHILYFPSPLQGALASFQTKSKVTSLRHVEPPTVFKHPCDSFPAVTGSKTEATYSKKKKNHLFSSAYFQITKNIKFSSILPSPLILSKLSLNRLHPWERSWPASKVGHTKKAVSACRAHKCSACNECFLSK